jgi:glycosyltransferase 2 family protein
MPNQPPSVPVPPRRTRMWLGILRWFVFLVVISYVAQSLRRGVSELQARGVDWSEIKSSYLLLAAVFYVLAQVPSAFFWRWLIVVMGQKPGYFESWRAFFIGHLGKYIPGKLAVVAIRGGLIRTQDVHLGIASLSVFVETFTMMIAGTILASIIMMSYPQTSHLQNLQIASWCIILLLIPTIYPPVIRVVARFVFRWQRDRRIDEWLKSLHLGTMLIGMGLSTLTWLLMTASFCCVTLSLPMDDAFPATWNDAATSLCAICMSVVAGFVTLMPGGLGVREWVGDQLLAPRLGPAFAIISMGLLRLVWLGAELAVSLILYFIPGRDSASHPRRNSL